MTIWSYSESEAAANEVSTAANEIAVRANGEAVAIDVGEARSGVRSPGRKIVVRPGEPGDHSPDVVAEAIFRAARVFPPSAILVAATRQGREVASRLAVKMNRGCLADIFDVSVEGNSLGGKRHAFAGKVVANVSSPLPCVATVKVGFYAQLADTAGSVQVVDVGRVEAKTRVVQVMKKETGSVDLKSAKIIVSAGRGVKRKEDLAILMHLATKLGGALGCSRPVSSDLGWLPEEHHIGLTGVTVHPDLYLAVGISGQLQHVAGIKDSRVIAAINTDRDAPIFQAADYGVVGDLYQVVPAIERALASRLG